MLSQCRSQRQQRLTRTRTTCQCNQLYLRIKQNIHRKCLLCITWLNTKIARLIHPTYHTLTRHVSSQHTRPITLQHKTLISYNIMLKIKILRIQSTLLGIQLINQIRLNILKCLIILLKNINTRHLIRNVILCQTTHCASLHSQINILCNKY